MLSCALVRTSAPVGEWQSAAGTDVTIHFAPFRGDGAFKMGLVGVSVRFRKVRSHYGHFTVTTPSASTPIVIPKGVFVLGYYSCCSNTVAMYAISWFWFHDVEWMEGMDSTEPDFELQLCCEWEREAAGWLLASEFWVFSRAFLLWFGSLFVKANDLRGDFAKSVTQRIHEQLKTLYLPNGALLACTVLDE